MRLGLKPVTELGDGERNTLKALTAAVYPAEVLAARPGRSLQWAPSEWSVLVWTVDGQLIAHVGIVTREGTLHGVPVKIGGIGSVKTHPQAQGRGYASAALRRAAAALDARPLSV
ncbi:MAG: GNAT family N-acetyltransferase [Nitrospinae bacterium]|nr:GNAT family N-acetyltransferase [Nitrospinota bacterium]